MQTHQTKRMAHNGFLKCVSSLALIIKRGTKNLKSRKTATNFEFDNKPELFARYGCALPPCIVFLVKVEGYIYIRPELIALSSIYLLT